MSTEKPSYDELQSRLLQAEAIIAALQNEQVDGVVGRQRPSLLEPKNIQFELETHRVELEMQNEQLRETENQLEQSRNRYRDLYNFAPVGYITLDDNDEIVEANLTASKMLGIGLIGRRFTTMLDRDAKDAWLGHRAALLANGGQQSCEITFHLADENHTSLTRKRAIGSAAAAPAGQRARVRETTPRVYEVRSELAQTSGSDGNHLRAVLIDITEQRAAEEAVRQSEENFRKALEQLTVAVSIVQDGRRVFANDAATNLSGYSREELLEMKPGQHVDPEYVQQHQKMQQDCRERGVTSRAELKGPDRHGNVNWIDYSVAPVVFNGRPATLGVAIDITARKQAEQKSSIRAQQQRVVAELGQLALSGVEFSELMDAVTAAVAKTLNVEFCKILERIPAQTKLRLKSGVGWKEGLVGTALVAAGNSQDGYTLSVNVPVIVSDLRTDERFEGPALLTEHGVVSGMTVIIGDLENAYGVLGVHSAQQKTFTDDDAQFIQAVANLLAQAVERQRLEGSLRQSNEQLEQRVQERTQQLSESEERYRSFVKHSTEGVVLCRFDEPIPIDLPEDEQVEQIHRRYVFELANDSIAKMYGLGSADEMIGKRPSDIDGWKRNLTDLNRTGLRDWVRSGYRHSGALSEEVDGDGQPMIIENDRVGIVEDGYLVKVWSIQRNVTERILAERQLRASEERFRSVFEQAAVGVAIIETATGEFVRINDRYAHILGTSVEKAIGKAFMQFTHADDLQTDLDQMQRLNQGEIREFSLEKRYVREDDSEVWVNLTVSPLWQPGDKATFHIAIVQDITERKRAERALRESEYRLRLVTDAMPAFISYTDQQQRLQFANVMYQAVFGLNSAEIQGRSICDVVGEGYESIRANVERALSGKQFVAEERLPVDGEMRDFEVNYLPHRNDVGETIGYYVLAIDITERNRAEQEIHHSAARLAEAQQVARIGSWEHSLVDLSGWWSDSHYELWGVPSDFDPTFEAVMELIVPEERAEIAEKMLAIQAGLDHVEAEFHIRRPDNGEIRLMEATGRTVFDDDGKPLRLIGACRDITAERADQQALRESEQRLRLVTDAIPEFISYVDDQLRFQFNNAHYENTFGISREQIRGKHISEVLSAEQFDHYRPCIEALLATGEPQTVEFDVLLDGQQRIMEVRLLPKIEDDGHVAGFYIVSHDLTERKRATERIQQQQEQLAHMGRLQIVGEMGSGMAHELNQPLGAIAMQSGIAGMILRNIEDDSLNELREAIEQIETQSLRAGEVINMIRELSTKTKPRRTSIELATLIDNCLRLVDFALRDQDIKIVRDFPGDFPALMADEVQITQVLVNLLNNAIEAMEQIPPDERVIEICVRQRDDDSICAAVSDRGHGVDADAQKVFEPFVTTKSGGMGMGLAICRSIVESHGGQMQVRANPMGGATFEFTLPSQGLRE